MLIVSRLLAVLLFAFLSDADSTGPDKLATPLPSLLNTADVSTTLAADRAQILEVIKNFYIGDHTGSMEHRQLSMHKYGAYRYVDKNGDYQESRFQIAEGNGDMAYTEELLSVEIYENVALARLRLENERREEAEYKLMTLHKSNQGWLITGISWGWGITH